MSTAECPQTTLHTSLGPDRGPGTDEHQGPQPQDAHETKNPRVRCRQLRAGLRSSGAPEPVDLPRIDRRAHQTPRRHRARPCHRVRRAPPHRASTFPAIKTMTTTATTAAACIQNLRSRAHLLPIEREAKDRVTPASARSPSASAQVESAGHRTVTTHASLQFHPVRCDGMKRPEHDHHTGRRQLLFDVLLERHTGRDESIPEDGPTSGFECVGEGFRARGVLSRIAQEEISTSRANSGSMACLVQPAPPTFPCHSGRSRARVPVREREEPFSKEHGGELRHALLAASDPRWLFVARNSARTWLGLPGRARSDSRSCAATRSAVHGCQSSRPPEWSWSRRAGCRYR